METETILLLGMELSRQQMIQQKQIIGWEEETEWKKGRLAELEKREKGKLSPC